MGRQFVAQDMINAAEIRFTLGERNGRILLGMTVGADCSPVAFVTKPAVTLWPRCTGDGNFGSMWGPSEVSKAKYTLDLTDQSITGELPNEGFSSLAALCEAIDDSLLSFVYANQLKILGRKNLSRDEVKMLQIRSVKPKYDRNTGQHTGNSLNLSLAKFGWNGIGGKCERKINVCDSQGVVIPEGVVAPGDVVCATMFANQVYTGVGGDKFGIHWAFEDVSVVCQRAKLEAKTEVSVFCAHQYSFAQPYADLSETMMVADAASA